ncbi:hypothetical protein XmelCFBP4644_13350 [Xanthomonas melonis]|uniref:Uncharacterized protein n=1 Tax=Xanthomonas melonis TaxID=56456 RepID=A0A2S7DDW5_9XANT|nr:hypothetical protein XmelCFBP4644_13350 [Xanthomonas melonis]
MPTLSPGSDAVAGDQRRLALGGRCLQARTRIHSERSTAPSKAGDVLGGGSYRCRRCAIALASTAALSERAVATAVG